MNRTSIHLRPAFAGLAFSWIVGTVAWAILIASALGWIPSVSEETSIPPLWFALFFAFILLARGLAIPITRGSVASLDAGFYLAAAVCLGPLNAGLLVAVALTLDSLWRAIAPGPSVDPKRTRASYVFYFGGVSGALLMLLAGGFGLDETLRGSGDVELVLKVLGVGLLFLVSHYSIQGIRHILLGRSIGRVAKTTLLPVMIAESSLMPLAVVVVFLYDPSRPLPFALLGMTYLVLNYGYNRISSITLSLRARVSELEVLNTSSRHLASSLESKDLVSVFAGEVFRAARGAHRVRIYHKHGETAEEETWQVEEFDRELSKKSTTQARPPEDVAKVLAERKPLMGRRKSENGKKEESWMAAPLEVHGELVGVVAAIAEREGGFRPEQFSLLQSVAQQGAVALDNVRLYELAMFDGLTGLFVRRYFDARLREEYQRSLRFGTEFSVVMMDLDDFKNLNDTLGHQAGDSVLRKAAEVVKAELRGVDAAARYGGEEFALILPRTPLVDAMNLADRIRQQIAKIEIDGGDGRKVTASFGIASCVESAPTSDVELVDFADQALYRAKRAGKNRVELYWPNR